ncbi:TPA: hypothetical protein RTG57_001717 [Campylobacter jejuni]|nr:hypothetical protein [Campylobacter jejuni]
MVNISTNFCSNGSYVKQIEWFQITPLLVNADKVLVTKSRIDSKGTVTTDINKWALKKVNWIFNPFEDACSIMTISTLDEKGYPDDKLEESFDFLSGAFKFYYNTLTDKIFGEIIKEEAGFNVTYRYDIEFYGRQRINNDDLLVKNENDASKNSSNINNVIAL